jgi:hypothetical protein
MTKRGRRRIRLAFPSTLLEGYASEELSLQDIAQQYRVSTPTARRELHEALPFLGPRRPGRKPGSPPPSPLDFQAAALYREGQTLRRVAAAVGLSPEGVRQMLRRLQVPLRPRGPLAHGA